MSKYSELVGSCNVDEVMQNLGDTVKVTLRNCWVGVRNMLRKCEEMVEKIF